MDKVRKARPQLLVGTPGRVADLAYEWGKLKLQRVPPRMGLTQALPLGATVRCRRAARPEQPVAAPGLARGPSIKVRVR